MNVPVDLVLLCSALHGPWKMDDDEMDITHQHAVHTPKPVRVHGRTPRILRLCALQPRGGRRRESVSPRRTALKTP